MSEPRPAKYPEWASGVSGVAGQTEPTTTQKLMGWQSNTAPPASYFNWWMGGGSGAAGVYRWTKYFDDRISYDTALVDDFVTPTLIGHWSGSTGVSTAGVDASHDAVGRVQLLRSSNGSESLTTSLSFRTVPNDWLMQFRVRIPSFGASGSLVTCGWQNAPNFAIGASGNWILRDITSWVADLGVSLSASGYQNLELRFIENGPRLEASIDDVLVYGASHAPIVTGGGDIFQVQITAQGGTVQCLVDRVKFGVRR